MYHKHASTVTMISKKAKLLQKESKLKIIAAYYGKKSAIKDWLDTKVLNQQSLISDTNNEQ